MAAALTPPRDCTFPAPDWQVLAGYWHPVAAAGSVTERPVAARLLDQDLVVYRTPRGIKVAADLCAHRGAPLSMGRLRGGRLVCAYHGYCYDDTGRCISIPAHPDSPIPGKLQLRMFPSAERHGLVWVCLAAEPKGGIPPFPEFDDEAFQNIALPPLDWAASAGRQLESFCDVAHFAFVHENTFAVRDPVVPRYEARATPEGVFAEFVSQAGNVSDPAAAAQTWRRVYQIHLPFTAHLVVHFPSGGRLAMLNASCPVSARRTRVFPIVARDFERDQPVADLISFQQRIYTEDQAVVERQNPEDLPIDLAEEVHVRADLTSVTYRRQLAALGLGRGFTS
ncbi:MAG TPA: Rieske 2Fe-2S domain-containing protein [Candidatus Didemnitutus sp.]|jgi:vanillate O-demethylase monooxygenase subunit